MTRLGYFRKVFGQIFLQKYPKIFATLSTVLKNVFLGKNLCNFWNRAPFIPSSGHTELGKNGSTMQPTHTHYALMAQIVPQITKEKVLWNWPLELML